MAIRLTFVVPVLAVMLASAAVEAAVAPAAPSTVAPAPMPPAEDEPGGAGARAALLDTLFNELARARSVQESKAIEAAIFKIWMESGSPSIDLLMSHGLDAFEAKDYDRALFYFSEVVTLQPDFAEGWDKRATVYFLKNEYAEALKDLEHVLRLEPRNFNAMGGLAVILEELGDKRGALDLYRRALKIDPQLGGAAEAEKSLSIDVEGRGI